MKLTKLMPIATALVLAACGTQDKKGSDKAEDKPAETTAPTGSSEAPAQQEEVAPETIIVKVPVDADGNELTDQIESRQAKAGADVAAQFEAGQGLEVKDELDQDTSSQEWGRAGAYWNTPWYPGKLLGRGLWWGRNPYTSYGNSYGYGYGYSNNYGNGYGGYGNGYGNSYGGYGYTYSYVSTYRSNGCNYYTYGKPSYYNGYNQY